MFKKQPWVIPILISCLAGSGSISSGSAKSVSTLRSESRLEESLSGCSAISFPGSPKPGGTGSTADRISHPPVLSGIAGTAVSPSPLQLSRSEESLHYPSHAADNDLYQNGFLMHEPPSEYDANDYNEMILEPSSNKRDARHSTSKKKSNPLTTSSIVRR